MGLILRTWLTFGLLVLCCRQTRAIDMDLAHFVTAKQSQLRDYARDLTNPVPRTVWSFFDAVRVDDWETATNLASRIDVVSGRFAGSPDKNAAAALQTLIWPPISEVVGAYDQFHNWDSKWLHRFAGEIIDSIPKGSIYFGGTDAGRFIISAVTQSQPEGKPFFTITQNQLADAAYLDYLRKMYGDKIYIPTPEDAQNTFKDYLTDAQQRLKNGTLLQGEDVKTEEGRIQVAGQVAVMQINGLLAKTILQKNPAREVYVEESYPLEWMYSQLTPHGLIMQLHHRSLASLPADDIEKDNAFWGKLMDGMVGPWLKNNTSAKEICDFSDRVYLHQNLSGFKGDSAFIKNEQARKCFSKLRCAIASLYAWRAEHAEDIGERNDARLSADLAFRQAFALSPTLPEAIFRYTRFLRNLQRIDEASMLAVTALRLEPDDTSLRELVRSLKEAE
jgi:hypothetical protein